MPTLLPAALPGGVAVDIPERPTPQNWRKAIGSLATALRTEQRKMKRLLMGLLATNLLLFAAAAMADSIPITLTSNTNVVYAYDASNSDAYAQYTGTTIPTSTFIEATDGASRSRMDIQWSQVSAQTLLHFALDQERGGDYSAYALAYDTSTYFTALDNTIYRLSGQYAVTDSTPGQSGRVYSHVTLYDHTDAFYLFDNYQDSMSTHDESFTLGEKGGDFNNTLGGSLQGNLVAGHQYSLSFNMHTQAYPNGDDGATARGFVTLAIGEAATVPTPRPSPLYLA